jgi:hypothetical protein
VLHHNPPRLPFECGYSFAWRCRGFTLPLGVIAIIVVIIIAIGGWGASFFFGQPTKFCFVFVQSNTQQKKQQKKISSR